MSLRTWVHDCHHRLHTPSRGPSGSGSNPAKAAPGWTDQSGVRRKVVVTLRLLFRLHLRTAAALRCFLEHRKRQKAEAKAYRHHDGGVLGWFHKEGKTLLFVSKRDKQRGQETGNLGGGAGPRSVGGLGSKVATTNADLITSALGQEATEAQFTAPPPEAIVSAGNTERF